jgi:hypothetical protein
MVEFCEGLAQNYCRNRPSIKHGAQDGIDRAKRTSHLFEIRPHKVWVSGRNVLLDETHSFEEFVACFTTVFSLVFLFHMSCYSAGYFPFNASASGLGRALILHSLLQGLPSVVSGVNTVAIDKEARFLVNGFFPTLVSERLHARGW